MRNMKDALVQRKKALRTELARMNKLLEKAPRANLQICKSKTGMYFYSNLVGEDGKRQRRYIRKEDTKTLAALALKYYCLRRKKEISRELEALENYQQKTAARRIYDSTTLLFDTPVLSPLLQQQLRPMAYQAAEWAATGEPSTYREEEKVHVSQGGLKVRSKAEAMIASCLEERQIPFRYEDQIQIGRHRALPDFTLMNPVTGEKIYWEHFGMMDDERYLEGAAEKMSMYQEGGIYLGVNLILTVESQFQPLTYQTIRGIVEGVMPFLRNLE